MSLVTARFNPTKDVVYVQPQLEHVRTKRDAMDVNVMPAHLLEIGLSPDRLLKLKHRCHWRVNIDLLFHDHPSVWRSMTTINLKTQSRQTAMADSQKCRRRREETLMSSRKNIRISSRRLLHYDG